VGRVIAGVLIGAALLGVMAYAMLAQTGVTCEVCLEYRGRRLCERAAAADAARATMQATASVCAQLSSGVTDGIQCNASQPLTTQCSE